MKKNPIAGCNLQLQNGIYCLSLLAKPLMFRHGIRMAKKSRLSVIQLNNKSLLIKK